MHFKSLQLKLTVMVLTILAVSNVLLTYVARALANSTVQESVRSQMDSTRENVESKINAETEKHFRLLEGIAATDAARNPDLTLWERCSQITNIKSINSVYENISYYDVKGETYEVNGKKVNMGSSDFFQKALVGKRYMDLPAVSSVTGGLLQHYSVPVYGFDGRISGVIVGNVNGEALSEQLRSVKFGNESHIMVIEHVNGNIVASNNFSDVANGKSIQEEAGTDKNGLLKLVIPLMAGETGGSFFIENGTGRKMTGTYSPIEGTDWSVLCYCPYDDFYGALFKMLRIMGCLLAGVLVIAFFVTSSILAMSVKPLLAVKKSIEEIASGDADLTKRIITNSHDEIGDVVRGFNAFTEKLQSIISMVKISKSELGSAGENLSACTGDTSAAITQIIANISSVHSQITAQGNSVHDTAGAVNEIASNIDSLERMIENQSSGVAQASAAVEEMIGNIQSVNNSVEKMTASFDTLSSSAQNGTKLQSEVNERITQIMNMSETLQEANSAIAAIAEQTNLLAMNAAIEAAHAGEAGKGFSVVADEIRKLSETSSQQSKTIGEELNNIQGAISGMVEASRQSNQAFIDVTSNINATDQLVRQIQAAMQEQNEGSMQISQALHEMNDSTVEVRTASHEMSEGNKSILEDVRQLQEATFAMQGSMDEMGIGARKINETGAALTDIAHQMEESISNIENQIDKFKV